MSVLLHLRPDLIKIIQTSTSSFVCDGFLGVRTTHRTIRQYILTKKNARCTMSAIGELSPPQAKKGTQRLIEHDIIWCRQRCLSIGNSSIGCLPQQARSDNGQSHKFELTT